MQVFKDPSEVSDLPLLGVIWGMFFQVYGDESTHSRPVVDPRAYSVVPSLGLFLFET